MDNIRIILQDCNNFRHWHIFLIQFKLLISRKSSFLTVSRWHKLTKHTSHLIYWVVKSSWKTNEARFHYDVWWWIESLKQWSSSLNRLSSPKLISRYRVAQHLNSPIIPSAWFFRDAHLTHVRSLFFRQLWIFQFSKRTIRELVVSTNRMKK